jgi:hypothetical protein
LPVIPAQHAGASLALRRLKEEEVKLSREFHDEQQARARERDLQAMGYRAWLNRNGEGTWQLFWIERFN